MTPAKRKRCTGRCGRWLPVDADHFHRHRHSSDGFRARCRSCVAADRRDDRQSEDDAKLQARLAAEGAETIADAYRKGRDDGASAALRVLRAEGRLLPSDDEAAAQARSERIAAMADEVLTGARVRQAV